MGAQSIVGVGGGGVLDLGESLPVCTIFFIPPRTTCTYQTTAPIGLPEPKTAKAVAGLTLARGGCKDFLRVFHQEKELVADRLPVVAVPTTAR
jgi:alcohol dehydrogenase class IV